MGEQGRPKPLSVASTCYNEYPPPLAKYKDVVGSRKLFMSSLMNLHGAMGTKFMIPIIGGRELDLHKLFVEVTLRGGIEKVLREKEWKQVTAAFNFPSTATNASFVMRKYYHSLLQHYEQLYYFQAPGWVPSPTGALQSPNATPVAVHGLAKISPSSAQAEHASINPIEYTSEAGVASSVGSPVIGVIDGKIENGYLVTVTYGKEKLKGVLYHASPAHTDQLPQNSGVSTGKTNSTPPTSGVHHKRRRRRCKSEIRKRDPALPKPNRSGYNFFFAEQHARLKPLHPGKDREISRMIGELWNKLNDDERAVYQGKAMKDKERYVMEMEEYRKRLRENQVISDAVPIRQRFPDLDINMVELEDVKDETEQDSPENASNSSTSESEDDDQVMEKGDENGFEVGDGAGVESGNAGSCGTSGAPPGNGDL